MSKYRIIPRPSWPHSWVLISPDRQIITAWTGSLSLGFELIERDIAATS